jgi:hypothetical protein
MEKRVVWDGRAWICIKCSSERDRPNGTDSIKYVDPQVKLKKWWAKELDKSLTQTFGDWGFKTDCMNFANLNFITGWQKEISYEKCSHVQLYARAWYRAFDLMKKKVQK